MGKAIAQSNYRKLVTDIVALYANAKKTVTLFYWQTGKRIVEVEQRGEVKAAYGVGLLQELSEDLIKKCGSGSGFSQQNLRRMRQFYLVHPKCSAPSELTWTQYVELLPVKDDRVRIRLERRIVKEGLGSREVRRLVRTAQPARQSVAVPAKKFPPLKRSADLKLNTYEKITGATAAVHKAGKDQVLLDCGFFVILTVTKAQAARIVITDKPSYTYAATVERVVDGDTLLVVITLGFNISVRERLRLRGIDTPELGTTAGEKAKRYMAKILPIGSPIIIKSHKTDSYGRFVADVFYKPTVATEKSVLGNGIYLNQQLLDEGLAVRA